MTSVRDRLRKLEGPIRAAAERDNAMARDAADFDRRTAALAERMTPEERDHAAPAWAIGKSMLRSWPGCAAAFAGMTMEDFRC